MGRERAGSQGGESGGESRREAGEVGERWVAGEIGMAGKRWITET